MPTIKPFYGIRPNPDYAGKVVLDVENLSLDEAKIIRQENPYSYVNMLVPKLDNLFLRGSKNELAFKKINENFEEFIENGVLIQDVKPSVYVYRISKDGKTQTGIWTITSVDDCLDNTIKKHELTKPDREAVLIDYLQQTGIDANPVLITYKPVAEIDRVIDQICQGLPDLSFSKNDSLHELWRTDDSHNIQTIVDEFKKLPSAYIADGHHRAAAASLSALKQRQFKPGYSRTEEFNFFTTVYMASNQLKIYPFHRMGKDLNGLTSTEFIETLGKHFELERSNCAIMPERLHKFGMYISRQWYKLTLKTAKNDQSNAVSDLDVSILQELVFHDILEIEDSRVDPRISFVGGLVAPDVIEAQVDNGEYAVAFTLFATSIEQLIKVADQGGVMPPKSTWFEPKFQAGLLIHKINQV
ncbi:DUF1015 domain-containing protein [Daejeonella lutea]|uniref:Uncharacterized conserved protein, DUF1015 family n=1 Tax=Daejeonella lutea TaxID=572036 RepID=A0A1T5AHY0_9SPHI|nr:DUF1015 domain-containing protein [Daejeonella lutea]SKB34598.1 Uncharacterized conserved protein, DUF1015 family [Daejeonella lutea]